MMDRICLTVGFAMGLFAGLVVRVVYHYGVH